MNGRFRCENILLSHILMISTKSLIEFQRFQFIIILAFAMAVCGCGWELPCFSHGQLCVVCSRIGSHTVCFCWYGLTGFKYDVIKYVELLVLYFYGPQVYYNFYCYFILYRLSFISHEIFADSFWTDHLPPWHNCLFQNILNLYYFLCEKYIWSIFRVFRSI